MTSFFRGSVQSTPFQQAIERVTDGNQQEEDWGTIMKICDHVAGHEESAKEAMKVIRKRLQFNQAPTGWRSIALTVTVSSPLVIHFLDLFRVPLKNTFDTYFTHFVETRIDEILSNDENIVDVIHALRDTIFPDVATDKGPADLVNFEDVIAVADEFIPTMIKRIIGQSNVDNGLQILLQHFQDPLLNKQLFYLILDEALFELFPELRLQFSASRTSTMTTN